MSIVATMCESQAVDLQRPGIGQDTSGGTTQVFSSVPGWVALPCSVAKPSSSPIVLYEQRNYQNATELWFPTGDPGAQINDNIYVMDRTGRTYIYLVEGEAQPVGRGRLFSVQVMFKSMSPNT